MENTNQNSPWIDELLDVYSDGGEWDDFLPTLKRIDELLKLSMLSTDSPSLHRDLLKEIMNGN